MKRVAYLGPEGSFSEEAARAHYGDNAQLIAFPDIPGVVASLAHHLVEAAVVPIENSIEGAVNVTLDQLIHSRVTPRIAAELNLAVRHHLVGRPGTGLGDIERLVAHPQALAQCR